MSFSQLYDEVQKLEYPVSTRWLREHAIKFSTITAVKEQWSGLINPEIIRGFYIEGPIGPPIPLAENESLITLARAMCKGRQGDYWRRFVYTKELMHVFDEDEEKASDAAKFDLQIERFADFNAPMSPQYRAETKAFWRALGVLCPEKSRKDLCSQLEQGNVSIEVVAASLRLPVEHIHDLMRPDFEAIISRMK